MPYPFVVRIPDPCWVALGGRNAYIAIVEVDDGIDRGRECREAYPHHDFAGARSVGLNLVIEFDGLGTISENDIEAAHALNAATVLSGFEAHIGDANKQRKIGQVRSATDFRMVNGYLFFVQIPVTIPRHKASSILALWGLYARIRVI